MTPSCHLKLFVWEAGMLTRREASRPRPRPSQIGLKTFWERDQELRDRDHHNLVSRRLETETRSFETETITNCSQDVLRPRPEASRPRPRPSQIDLKTCWDRDQKLRNRDRDHHKLISRRLETEARSFETETETFTNWSQDVLRPRP